MAVSYERVNDSHRDRHLHVARDLTFLARDVLVDLIEHYPMLPATRTDVRSYYKFMPRTGITRPAQSFASAILGSARDRLGERSAQVYLAHDGSDLVGWLTTAAAYSNNAFKREIKSYLWLVNGGIEPGHQGNGVMKELLHMALTDKEGPQYGSLITRVSAYPVVLPPELGITLPVEGGLQRLGFKQTGEPFEDDAVFGRAALMRRYEGGSPSRVAAKL